MILQSVPVRRIRYSAVEVPIWQAARIQPWIMAYRT